LSVSEYRLFLGGSVVLARLILVLCLSLLGAHLQAAVGPQCFNCETYEHENPAALVLHRAFINYGPLEVIGRHAAIPALAAGVYPLGISLMSHGMPPIPWQHGVWALAGGLLTLQEACQMADTRQALGIDVKFRHPLSITAMALGFGVPAAAPFAGMAPAAFAVYLNNALRGGGYFAHQAASIYRLRHNMPQPNFLLLGLPGGGAAPANCVVIHFHNTMRISKNLKELSHNSLLAPGVGGLAYISIKDIIDNQFAAAGLPAPSGATVVSADFLQPD
jgi:hypothetical protein